MDINSVVRNIFWERIIRVSSQISCEEVHNLPSSVDRRFMEWIKNGGKQSFWLQYNIVSICFINITILTTMV